MDELFVIDHRFHGRGVVKFAWQPQGNLLATTGSTRTIHIFDCHGTLVTQITPSGTNVNLVSALEWDPRGDVLAISQSSTSTVMLWYRRSQKVRKIDVGVRDVTVMAWSQRGEFLALGTGKGTLCIYHRNTHEKVWVAGKHKRRIVGGAWNKQNKLAYASEDRQISIATEDGVTQDQVKVKCRPYEVAFGGKTDQHESIVSVNMEGRTILLYNLADQDNALELAFQQRYGGIVMYKWFGDGYIIAGFSSGFVVVISTHMYEIGREQYCAKFHHDELRAFAYCAEAQRLATCGDRNCVKLIDMGTWRKWDADSIRAPDLQEIKSVYLHEAGELHSLGWAPNGKLLSVSSWNGSLYTYVVRSCNDDDMTYLYPHPTLVKALKPLPAVRAVGFILLVSAGLLLALACHLGAPVSHLARVLLGGRCYFS